MYSIRKLAGAARAYPQRFSSAQYNKNGCIYNALHRTLNEIESCFDLLEKAMQGEFLAALFGEAIDDSDYELKVAQLPVKYSGLAPPNTVNAAKRKHQASTDI